MLIIGKVFQMAQAFRFVDAPQRVHRPVPILTIFLHVLGIDEINTILATVGAMPCTAVHKQFINARRYDYAGSELATN